jgi:uncharacterized protein YdhG (YjbR/CyaY superfamily)
MTKGKPATVENYIAGFPPDIAFILERLRETVLKAAPGATEEIKYGMPLFRMPAGYIFYMGAWKKHVGLYPVYPQSAELEAEIGPLRSGKDTVKLVYAKPLPYPLIAQLVKTRVKKLKAKVI